MADKKVSQLTALTGANTASGDLLYIVDISEPVAADQSKKITLTEFQSAPISAGTANGVAFLNASKVLTTGSALTFDGTSQFKVNIASATSGASLVSSGDFGVRLGANSTNGALIEGVDKTGAASYQPLYIGGLDLRFTNSGSEQMRLTTTGLGIGTSSISDRLTVAGNVTIPSNNFYKMGTGNYLYSDGANTVELAAGTSGKLSFVTNGALRATLDASGNLGLGVVPSAWSGYHAIQMGAYANFYNTNAGQTGLATSTYNNGTNWIYNSNNPAFRYEQDLASQSHRWFIAPTGTAGNAITFTQAMTLDSSGNLVVGTTGTAQGRVHAHATTNAQFVATDATLGTTYGGVFRGYGVVGQGGNAELGVLDNGSYTKAIKILDNATGIQFFTGVTNAGSTERARITSVGNFKIGGTADRATTEGTNQLVLFNGTAPVGTLTNGVSFYSESGEARVMDAAGNSTLLSPHDTATNEWIFHSKHTPTGKVLRIDVERLLKFVNDHFGLDAVHEFIEE